jgi:hypothetical protein
MLQSGNGNCSAVPDMTVIDVMERLAASAASAVVAPVNRNHTSDASWVMGEVQAIARANLDDLAVNSAKARGAGRPYSRPPCQD